MMGEKEGSIMVPAMEGMVWTFALVEERLIEAAALWRRAPGGGAWPFASDGPWHLIQGEAGDYDARGGDGVSSDVPLKPLPLRRDEVRRRDEASAWIEKHVEERDRRLMWFALYDKADGRRPDWVRMLRRLGQSRGADGLRMRYSRAVTRVVKALDKGRVPVASARL